MKFTDWLFDELGVTVTEFTGMSEERQRCILRQYVPVGSPTSPLLSVTLFEKKHGYTTSNDLVSEVSVDDKNYFLTKQYTDGTQLLLTYPKRKYKLLKIVPRGVDKP